MPIWVSDDHSAQKVFIRHIFADRQSWLLAGILPNGYGNMGPFCFDFNCKDQPIMVSLSTWSLEVF